MVFYRDQLGPGGVLEPSGGRLGTSSLGRLRIATRCKAKSAKKIAVEAYLAAEEIKFTYNLVDNESDSDNSDSSDDNSDNGENASEFEKNENDDGKNEKE